MKTIGVIGTRRRDTEEDFLEVEKVFFRFYKPGDIICSGLCPRGGDRFAVILQRKYNLKYIWYPADWKRYGKRAGFLRNTDIALTSDILIARIHPDRTGGTEDTIKKFIKFKGNDLNLRLIYDKSPLDEIF